MSIQIRSSDADPGKRFFRSSDRVFRQSDGWYYSAREGDHGPFRDEPAARDAIRRYVRERQLLERTPAGKTSSVGKTSMSKKSGDIEFTLEPNARRRGSHVTPPRDVWRGRPDVD